MATLAEQALEREEVLENEIDELKDLLEEIKTAKVCPSCHRLELPPGNHECEVA